MKTILVDIFARNPIVSLFLFLVIIVLLGLGYLGFKMTRGLINGYLKANIGEKLKGTLLLIHGFGALLLGLILPNNYLNEITFIKELYDQNGLWIGLSMVVLSFLFLVIFGTVFTLLTTRIKR